MTLRLLLLLCLIFPILGYANDYYPSSINGLIDSNLKSMLGNHISQFKKITTISGDDYSLWGIFSEIDRQSNDNILCLSSISDSHYLATFYPPNGYGEEHIIHPNWIGDSYPYKLDPSWDLHIIFPALQEVIDRKNNYPPLNVSEIIEEIGAIKIGYSLLNNVKVNAYEPSDDYKGDIARVIMYAAVAYPSMPWQSLGLNIIMGGAYPTLNRAVISTLLDWHRMDPVSEKEINRNNGIYKYQLNRNPFIDFPNLPEYIWGNKMGMPFEFVPVENDPSEEKSKNLKSIYMIGDEIIYLKSKFVPENAIWKVNGEETIQKILYPIDLGIGIHLLEFYNATLKGQIKIQIIQ